MNLYLLDKIQRRWVMKEVKILVKPINYKDKKGMYVIQDWWMIAKTDELPKSNMFEDIIETANDISLVLHGITEGGKILKSLRINKQTALKLLKKKGYKKVSKVWKAVKYRRRLDGDYVDVYEFTNFVNSYGWTC
jgi:hypothetical protein